VARAHTSINAFILSCVAALAIGTTTACQETAQDVKQAAQKAEEGTRDERAAMKEKARELGSDAARAANRAGAAASQAGEEIAERAGAAWETIDVKGALMADASVDATRIDVDTNYKTKTVTLNGYVPTATEKDMAEVIAKGRAEGYTVVNDLVVQPRGR
jgi:osmotically-inducible protein OsmY